MTEMTGVFIDHVHQHPAQRVLTAMGRIRCALRGGDVIWRNGADGVERKAVRDATGLLDDCAPTKRPASN